MSVSIAQPFLISLLVIPNPSSSSFCHAASLSIHPEWIFTRLSRIADNVLLNTQTSQGEQWLHSQEAGARGTFGYLLFSQYRKQLSKANREPLSIRWIYLTYLHGCTPLWTHILIEGFAFICAPISMILKPPVSCGGLKIAQNSQQSLQQKTHAHGLRVYSIYFYGDSCFFFSSKLTFPSLTSTL